MLLHRLGHLWEEIEITGKALQPVGTFLNVHFQAFLQRFHQHGIHRHTALTGTLLGLSYTLLINAPDRKLFHACNVIIL